MRLYHFSEDPTISEFAPHRAPTSLLDEPLVWAIDEWHAPMYYFPRNCPRACYWPSAATTEADRERWMGDSQVRMVIAVESVWMERIRTVRLYRYELPDETFEMMDATAGFHVSRSTVVPLAVDPVGDLLSALAAAHVELHPIPSLGGLWRLIIASTLQFSGTRLRNAADYASWQLPT